MLLHLRSSWEATGEEEKKRCVEEIFFIFFEVLQCVKKEKKI